MWALRHEIRVFCAGINHAPVHVRLPIGRNAMIQSFAVTVGVLAGGSRGSDLVEFGMGRFGV